MGGRSTEICGNPPKVRPLPPISLRFVRRNRLEAFPILVLFVYEESAADDSESRPYFDVLPAEFTTPLADDRLGASLPADRLPARVRELLEKQRREFEEIREKVSSTAAAFFDSLL